MKVAFSGKGGVGKTTISSAICLHLAGKGVPVLAVDADTNPNLSGALGFEQEVTPVSEMKKLMKERTEVDPARPGIFKLNPRVDDIPERFALRRGSLTLVVMGSVDRGGKGCACPENTFLRELMSHLVIGENEWVVMDMEAGVEHLGRATARAVDAMVIVSEPTPRAALTGQRIMKLCTDLGIRRLGVVGNKVRGPADEKFLKERLSPAPLIGWLPFKDSIGDLERGGSQGTAAGVDEAEVGRIIEGIRGLVAASAEGRVSGA